MKFRDYSNYEIYDGGKIWSYKRSKFLKPSTLPNGYQKVTLTDNEGNGKSYYIHRIVWESVTGSPIPDGMQINHLSEVKTENFFENLQLVSPKQNSNYGSRNERIRKAKINGNHSKSVGAFKDGKIVMRFQSTKEAERQGYKHSAVSACCNGKIKTYKGYIWKFL